MARRRANFDSNALFFLRARGIPEAEARAMLVEAFLGEALDTIENEGLRAPCLRAYAQMAGAPCRRGLHVE